MKDAYSLTVGTLSSFDQLLFDQVTLLSRWLADVDGLVGEFNMQRVDISVRKDRYTLDAQAVGRAYDTTSDLASIGDQYSTNSHI